MSRYVCPMHPEVAEEGPGLCPKCGMALEPDIVAIDDGESEELALMRRRFWVSAALTLPVFLLGMAEMIPGDPAGMLLSRAVPGGSQSVFEMAMSAPVVLWGGWPFFSRAWASMKTMTPNMFTLVALGSGAAFAYSVVATLAPGVFPETSRVHHGEVGVYFEASAVIVTLVLLGQVLELRARSQTSGALRALLSLAPKTAGWGSSWSSRRAMRSHWTTPRMGGCQTARKCPSRLRRVRSGRGLGARSMPTRCSICENFH